MVIVSLLLSAAVGQASDIPLTSVYFCKLHYSSSAYNKKVKSVFAHTGVEDDCRQRGAIGYYKWQDVRDVAMELAKENTHFYGKVMLNAFSSTYHYNCSLKPVVQFWVTFDDGSQKIESIVPMMIKEESWVESNQPVANYPAAVNIVEKYVNTVGKDINTVECSAVGSYGEGALEFVEKVIAKNRG
jgi:hypothetical protein